MNGLFYSRCPCPLMENDRQWETHGQIAGKSWGSVQDQGEVRSADAPQGPDAPLAPWNPFQIHPGDMMFHHVLFCVHRLKTLQVACGCVEMSTYSLPKPSGTVRVFQFRLWVASHTSASKCRPGAFFTVNVVSKWRHVMGFFMI